MISITALKWLFVLAISYLLGSLNFSIILSKMIGRDIRKQGSGMHLRHGHGKSLQMRLNAHFPAFAH